jgi:hypothetical protein
LRLCAFARDKILSASIKIADTKTYNISNIEIVAKEE